jgi:hypothetical protein
MKTVSGHVMGNTVVLDGPLPEGSEVQVTLVDSQSHMVCEPSVMWVDDETAQRLVALNYADTHESIPAEEVFERLRSRIGKDFVSASTCIR